MSRYIHKKHNVSVFLYHLVCPLKYRKAIITDEVSKVLIDVCKEISLRYELEFIEIGTDKNHVHFLIQSVPVYSPTKICRLVKSLTAREIFLRLPWLRKLLWGGEFWTDGYFVSTVGHSGNEETIRRYVENQGKSLVYNQEYRQQLKLF